MRRYYYLDELADIDIHRACVLHHGLFLPMGGTARGVDLPPASEASWG